MTLPAVISYQMLRKSVIYLVNPYVVVTKDNAAHGITPAGDVVTDVSFQTLCIP